LPDDNGSDLGKSDRRHFGHSFQFCVADLAHLLDHADCGWPITAIAGARTVVGTRLHPEKSQATGLRLIRTFLRWTP